MACPIATIARRKTRTVADAFNVRSCRPHGGYALVRRPLGEESRQLQALQCLQAHRDR
jgi:hypothetical protein